VSESAVPIEVAQKIRLSSIGYFPYAEKKASIAASCTEFSVMRSNGTAVFHGTVTGPIESTDTGEQVYIADFSKVTESGIYYLDMKDLGRSFDFRIAEDVYNTPYKVAMLGMYLWRCGTGVSTEYRGTKYVHKACHLDDAFLDYVNESADKKDGIGGWHDAGDYNKYTVNAGATVGVMLMAWEHFRDKIQSIGLDVPEKWNSVPDYLDEIRWELDWLLKMQYPDGSGRISHKLSAKSFWGFLMPEFDTLFRYFTPWGSAATADFVAMMAQAARIYKQYDAAFAAACLAAAKNSYAFLKNNPLDHPANINGFATGDYQTTDPDDRLWAAAEMWETTGNAVYLSDFETRASGMSPKIETDWDWGNLMNLGMFTYLLSNREGKNDMLVSAIKADLIKTADSIVAAKDANAYARPFGDVYYWGCNGTVARQAVILHAADLLNPRPEYRATILDALNHLFGRNYYSRSFVTGLGYNPPMDPHDRRSFSDKVVDPWPGYLVGGGQSAKDWVDKQESYTTNEIAINWNAALIYAMAGFVKP
jgi:endoglucanase